jgi:hypothetical protein
MTATMPGGNTALTMRVLPVAAALLFAASLFAVAAKPASAATPECGDFCISIFSTEIGTSDDPGLVEAVLDGVAQVGQPVILAPASNSDPAQDFLPDVRPVSAYYQAGLVSAAINNQYGSLLAAQIQYAPLGQTSGLCVGLAGDAFQHQGLTLQPCSVSARTVWIVDTPATAPAGSFTIVNATTTDFAHPFAMTYPHDQQANDKRLQQILVRRLQYLGPDKAIPDRQLYGFIFGPLSR